MPASPSPGFLRDYLQFLLATASGLASHGFHLQAAEAGLPVAEWRVLACLSDRNGNTVTEIARLAQMEQSRLTKVIDRMDARALVRRERCGTDRRRVFVWLTPEGRRIAEDMVAQARAHEQAFLAACLTEREAARLKQLLTKVIDRASAETAHAVRR
ncbi:MAG: MarR family winged helix-turn-helix transcriptional regulator [Pseudorhodobacter sp.]